MKYVIVKNNIVIDVGTEKPDSKIMKNFDCIVIAVKDEDSQPEIGWGYDGNLFLAPEQVAGKNNFLLNIEVE